MTDAHGMRGEGHEAMDDYRGHICVTKEPGCTCGDHADALRERDALRASLAASEARARDLEASRDQWAIDYGEAAGAAAHWQTRVRALEAALVEMGACLIETVKYDDGTFMQTYKRCRFCLWGERNTVIFEHEDYCPLASDLFRALGATGPGDGRGGG